MLKNPHRGMKTRRPADTNIRETESAESTGIYRIDGGLFRKANPILQKAKQFYIDYWMTIL